MALVSIIIPVGPGDMTWKALGKKLRANGTNSSIDVIMSVSEHCPTQERKSFKEASDWGWKIIEGPKGRGRQLNLGASHAEGKYLWFVHGDSSFSEEALDLVISKASQSERCLYYFDLKFTQKVLPLMAINEVGVFIRSRFLQIPFGDQGFLLEKKIFEELGGYPEDAPYGEDHLLVWQCHKKGVSVRPIGDAITTSPRKYQKNGWLKTTINHLYLTGKQAAPELSETIKAKWGRQNAR